MLLAADTATPVLAVGLAGASGVRVERAVERGSTPRRPLVAELNDVLSEAGVQLAELDGLAVGVGPGSFTGVRIGIATLQGLALGCGRPLVAVSTLEAIARGAWRAGALDPDDDRLVVVADQGHGEVAWLAFRIAADGPVAIGEPRGDRPDAAVRGLPARTVLVGDALARHPETIRPALPRDVRWLGAALSVPRGGVVAEIGLARLRSLGPVPDAVLPHYIRPPDAMRRA